MDSKLHIARKQRNSDVNVKYLNKVIQKDRKYYIKKNKKKPINKQNFNLLTESL